MSADTLSRLLALPSPIREALAAFNMLRACGFHAGEIFAAPRKPPDSLLLILRTAGKEFVTECGSLTLGQVSDFQNVWTQAARLLADADGSEVGAFLATSELYAQKLNFCIALERKGLTPVPAAEARRAAAATYGSHHASCPSCRSGYTCPVGSELRARGSN